MTTDASDDPSKDFSNGLTRLSGGESDVFPFKSLTLLLNTDSLIWKAKFELVSEVMVLNLAYSKKSWMMVLAGVYRAQEWLLIVALAFTNCQIILNAGIKRQTDKLSI